MRMKLRLFTVLLCAAALWALCVPAAAGGGGEENVSYLDENGVEKVCDKAAYAIGTDWSKSDSPSGWYVASGSVEISGRVTVTGDVHLILKDRCDLTVTGGINVGEGQSLTIYAQSTDVNTMGKLTATATGGDAAGIGGGYNSDGGNITINGGTVEATGGYGAGIGGGSGGAGGEITITGGKVDAQGGDYGAGIGGGYGGAGGTITITGGAVSAKSRTGAGIGGGVDQTTGGTGCDGGKITITGGAVTATSDDGAGIGGGSGNYGSSGGNGGTIIISGGTVTVSSGGGAGIGGGAGPGGSNGGAGGNITINGGTVTASSGGGAGIGGGSGDYAGGSGGKITINGGTVEATGYNGAGIGGGTGSEMVGGAGGEITISGGTVTASGDHWGAGIGGGGSTTYGGPGGTITITGGTVTATGQLAGICGAGIGSGGSNNGLNGKNGTFITGPNGSAFIVASSISDNGDTTGWSGVIFEGDSGKVYGSEITLGTDAEIPANGTLEIGGGQTLIVGEDVTLTNNGTITGTGTIKGKVINNGTIENGITVQDHAHQWDTEWSSDATNHWHGCTVTGCGERSDTAGHVPGAAATCTEPQVCAVCGQETAPALGHSFGEKIPQKDATTASTGMKAHYLCSRCGNYFDENKNPTTAEALTIPKKASGSSGGSGGGSSAPTYKPDVSKPGEGGGAAAVSPANPRQGDTVTVTPKADEGFDVEAVTVTDGNGKAVEVRRNPDGTFSFVQPGSRVRIEVSYRAVEEPWSCPFTDVNEGDWYFEAVRFVQEMGLMNGYSDGRFGPGDTLSRAQLAQILFNREGGPVVNYLMTFSDVEGGAWYGEAVRWAASLGIVSGYGDGTFGPDAAITREQLAVMLWRYAGSPETGGGAQFADTAEVGAYAAEAVSWAWENGIVRGRDDGRFDPQGSATRAEAAQMMMNFMEKQGEGG